MTKEKNKATKQGPGLAKVDTIKAKTSLRTKQRSGITDPSKQRPPVAANSIDSRAHRSSLVRILEQTFRYHFRYLISENGGCHSPEVARTMIFGEDLSADEWLKYFKGVMAAPVDTLDFRDLIVLDLQSPQVAEDVWKLIKREARHEFADGHQAAQSLENLTEFNDAWARARYLGVRESFCREWRPRGGIELSMIDQVAQAWVQQQFWTSELVKRSQNEPREENVQFLEWKTKEKKENTRQWGGGFWDLPYVDQEKAIENAAAMVERFQRMYFRAIRALRDWRRYSPQLTINNANQVNIGSDGCGQVQINGLLDED